MICLEAQKGDCSILEHRGNSPKGIRPTGIEVSLEGRSARGDAGSEVFAIFSWVPEGGFVQVLDPTDSTPLGESALRQARLAADRILAYVDDDPDARANERFDQFFRRTTLVTDGRNR